MGQASDKSEKEINTEYDRRHSADEFPVPTVSNSPSPSSSISSQSSQHSRFGTGTHVHPSTSKMDGSDGYIRRRPLTMDANDVGDISKPSRKGHSRRPRPKRRNLLAQGDEQKRSEMLEDEHNSDCLTPSSSEEAELEHPISGDGLTDDEETGLTRKDKSRRKRRKRLNTHLDERVVASSNPSASRWSLADKHVVQASLVNALLIALWYIFSVSISVVRWKPLYSVTVC